MADRPTASAVRKARKAELIEWCQEFGLDPEGKVDELRERLLEYLKSPPPEPKPVAKAAKEEAAPEPEAEEEAEEEGEEAAGKEEKEEAPEEKATHAAKAKPRLDPSLRQFLNLRRQIASRRPRFLRQEWFRNKRLGEIWRNPKGMHSKLKRHWGYRPNVVSIGYRGPRVTRGLHPSGFREILVHTVRELDAIDPKVEAVRIGGTVGARRRTEIESAADEKGIRVLNRREER